MHKKSNLWPLLLLLAFANVGQSAPTNLFPLMAWDYADSEATLEAMRDCGVTSVAFVPPKMLDACEKLGLQAIVFDERISGSRWDKPFNGDLSRSNLVQVIKEIGNHPAIMGYHLKDEPGAGEFPELAKPVAAVKELAPGKWPYINLLPGDGASYDKYVEDFIAICKPTQLSYDRYVIWPGDQFNDGFWVNLAQVREAAVKHKLPFWNIVLTSPHWAYRELTETDVRLQNWGSLVYGVSGIAYYKFCSKELPILNAPDLGNFRSGPLDPFGEKTQTWNWLRNCNRQIHNIAPVFMKLRSDDVYHFGNIPTRNHGPTETNLVKSLPAGEWVVGDFTGEGGARYVMVVNKNLKTSATCVPEFNAAPKSVQYVSAITGEIKPFPTPYYWLAPGQGVLLKLE